MSSSRSQAGVCNFWVDVGALLRGRGNATGIPRLSAQLVDVWLRDAELRLRLCRFNATLQTYEEVPPEALCPPSPDAPAAETERGLMRRLWRTLPDDLRHACRDSCSAVRHLARLLLRPPLKLARSLRSRPAPGSSAAAPFQEGDVLLLPGAGWDDAGACAALARARRTGPLFVVPLLCDIVPVKLPHLCAPQMPRLFVPWIRALLPQSDLVLAISQHTRRDLLSLFEELPAPCPPIEVIRLGDELAGAKQSTRPSALPEGIEAFALSVGTIEPRKNHWLLYHLWRRLAEELGPRLPPLLLAGRPGWNTGDLLDQLRRDPLVRGRILLLEDVGDRELLWLYRHCLFTLYPSHYEGWGLPVAESLAHGKPCICSNTSSLPEIAPGLVDAHDPLDLEGCAQLVRRALLDADFLRQRQAHIRAEFRPTPWRECAARILSLIGTSLGVRCGAAPESWPLRRKAVGCDSSW